MTIQKRRVVVGMSGGVDSSVSALLLKQAGFEVIGLFMKNWEEVSSEGVCASAHDQSDVAKVCEILDIPYYTVNFAQEYQETVFSSFLDELKQGYTPNPDILCNREIKFELLLKKALELGADALATGHYAQNKDNRLVRSHDLGKDQTYFLYTLSEEKLSQVLFPIGHLLKKEVRNLAKEANLPVFDKKDSTGICFIGERNFSQFLSTYIPYQEGAIRTLSGEKIGTHRGIAHYTIGQRKGLGIGGKKEYEEESPWFVAQKETSSNTLFVVQGHDHPALYKESVTASSPSWIAKAKPKFPLTCSAKIRYRQEDQVCVVEQLENKKISIKFKEPQRAVTPRQSIVFYDQAVCLGGAILDS